MGYNPKEIEQKWSSFWIKNNTFKTDIYSKKPKCYVLDMFPYPSGSGLHVGHPKGYTATDIYSRFKRFKGYNVLHPIGWDAFGLPAEQYAIETGKDPAIFTQENIKNFKSQLKKLGFSFDYTREINTTDPNYYKWTQWIFIQLYKKGLASIMPISVNWCPELGTVLSNEEIKLLDGKMVSDRGNHPVIKKEMKQWVLKITKYADKLLEGLDHLDWPQNVKDIQKKWIGKTNGFSIIFEIYNENLKIDIFTSKIEFLHKIPFICINTNYKNIDKFISKINSKETDIFIENNKNKHSSNKFLNNEKIEFLNTNLFAINPLNNEKIPIFISNYLADDYNEGIILGMPFLNAIDKIFSKAINISFENIVKNNILINSGNLDGKTLSNAKKINKDILIGKGVIKSKVKYKLRDWIFSRQRYWGEPFPIKFYEDNIHLLNDDELPLLLPKSKNIHNNSSGEGPLKNIKDWFYFTEHGKSMHYDSNTMPQWAGSCWYYLAYLLSDNSSNGYIPLNSSKAKEIFKKWLPVDLYIGGQEHAVLHLLYARFWHMFLFDIGIVPNKEPFKKLFNQGMILGPDGDKMSKSKGNTINPDYIINDFGADTLRIYEMFMGPLGATLAWNNDSLKSIKKWLDRVYNFFNKKNIKEIADSDNINLSFSRLLKNVENNINDLKFNVCISEMMIFINICYKQKVLSIKKAEGFLIILSCFAPFIAEEINAKLFDNDKISISLKTWPTFEFNNLLDKNIKIIVQISGKTRHIIEAPAKSEKEYIFNLVMKIDKIKKYLHNKDIKKIIFIKDKLINLII